MRITVEAIIAIITLLVAIPPTLFVIVNWIKCRRRANRRREQRLQLYHKTYDPTIEAWKFGRRQQTINATFTFELGETTNLDRWDTC
ncbi:hypothetical protein QBC43DRAFT_287293 [Cladorrhinum sp. PSN259]|nr:hypothetical protein QBC43DRAFT_287293 [Cladorrhinum sp. PSN259]